MADQLHLSIWYPNFRVESLPAALTGVMRQFALIAKDGQANTTLGYVDAASAYPIDWTESPTYQRIYVNDWVNDTRAEKSADTEAGTIENAVEEATEQLYDDSAFEFEMRWMLWLPNAADKTGWKLTPWRVRIVGLGPDFDQGSYEQNGHIRVDFGLDTPWVPEDESLNETAGEKIKQNVEKLLAFTLSVEKHCGISTRLLWTESGEPLAEKLIARLQRLN